MHCTTGSIEQCGFGSAHSSTSTVHATVTPFVFQPWSQMHEYPIASLVLIQVPCPHNSAVGVDIQSTVRLLQWMPFQLVVHMQLSQIVNNILPHKNTNIFFSKPIGARSVHTSRSILAAQIRTGEIRTLIYIFRARTTLPVLGAYTTECGHHIHTGSTVLARSPTAMVGFQHCLNLSDTRFQSS